MVDLKDRILALSKEVQRHPRLKVLAIGDRELLEIAQEKGILSHEVMAAALEAKVWPNRYLRNTEALSIEEQKRLHSSHVAVIGAGGLGGQILSCLARVGVGNLTIVDSDRFEESNLNRQAFSDVHSLGSSKVGVVAERIGAINPFCRLRSFSVRFDESNSREILKGVQVVVDALDNREDRLLLQKVARDLGIALIHGAVAGLEGHVMTILPEDPGLEKIYGEGEVEDGMKPEQILGVLAPTPMLIGTIQAAEAIKFLLNRGRLIRSQLLYVDLESASFSVFQF